MSENQTNEKKKPVFSVKMGTIDGAVWEQDGKNGKFYTISTHRNYLDENDKTGGEKGTWKQTNSLRVNDAPAQMLVLQKCYEFCKTKGDATD